MRYQDLKAREAKVREMISEGMIVADMARALGITPQSVHKFLKTRGWDKEVTKGGNYTKHKEPADPEVLARKEARKAARKKMNSSVDRSAAKSDKRKAKTKG